MPRCDFCRREVQPEELWMSEPWTVCNDCRIPTSFDAPSSGGVGFTYTPRFRRAQEESPNPCSFCGERHGITGPYRMNDGREVYTCIDCGSDHFYVCECCGELKERTGDEQRFLYICETCRESGRVQRCHNCGVLLPDRVWTAHDEPHCRDCYNSHSMEEPVIKPFNYKPHTHFEPEYKKDQVYYGIELEVDGGLGESRSAAYTILQVLPECYAKHDGSLADGFELVSCPCTYDHFMSRRNRWVSAMGSLSKWCYRSNSTNTCGLHVHISREPFGEENVSKLIYIVHRFWPQFLRFSRRGPLDRLDRYAALYRNIRTVAAADRIRRTTPSYHDARYRAVNLTNPKTVELRFFKGTLNPVAFFATLQMCNLLVQKLPSMSVEACESITWNELVSGAPTELQAYLYDMGLMNVPNEQEACA